MAVPEMAGDYEILQSVRLGGRMMLLGYNPRDKEMPYMTCYQQYNLLGEKIFPQAVAGDNYVEILQIFLNRLQDQQKAVAEFREKRAVPIEVLGAEHCRERGEKESLEGKLVILRPTSLAAEYRTADCQLGYVEAVRRIAVLEQRHLVALFKNGLVALTALRRPAGILTFAR